MKGLISLGGGLPSSQYFPIDQLDIKVPSPPHFSENATKEAGIVKSAGKYDIAEGKSIYGETYGQSHIRLGFDVSGSMKICMLRSTMGKLQAQPNFFASSQSIQR